MMSDDLGAGVNAFSAILIAVAFALVLSWAKGSNTGVIYPAQEKENSMNCIRTDEEIARVENWAGEAVDDGTRNPGKSYEDGVYDTLMWLHGGSEKAPDEVDEEE